MGAGSKASGVAGIKNLPLGDRRMSERERPTDIMMTMAAVVRNIHLKRILRETEPDPLVSIVAFAVSHHGSRTRVERSLTLSPVKMGLSASPASANDDIGMGEPASANAVCTVLIGGN